MIGDLCRPAPMFLKRHLVAVPQQLAVESLQANGQYAHDDHFVERTGFAEVRCRFHSILRVFLAGADPVLLVADGDFAVHLRCGRLTTRHEPRIHAVAAAYQRVFRSIEDGSASLIVQRPAFGHAGGTNGRDASVVPGRLPLRAWRPCSFLRTGREDVLHHLGVRRAVREQRGRAALNAVEGYPSCKPLNTGCRIWHAMSPSAPVPKSHQPRQFHGV